MSLEEFCVPNEGEITLCEINGRVQCMNYEFANIGTFTNTTEKHPKIHITRDMLHHTALGDEGRELFITTEVPFLKQLTQIYTEQGFNSALTVASNHHQLIISQGALLLKQLLRTVRKVRILLNPSLQFHGAAIINDYSQTRSWDNNSVRCLAWQPHSSRIAIATSDDGVRIYSEDSTFVPLLKCKQQRNVSCIAWRPMSLTEIAVGHETGIIIWNVDFNSLVSRPSISNTIMLHRVDHQPIISLSWSPRGDILTSAAACDSIIYVWDVELDRTSILKGSRECGNILLKWSPAKDKLLSVSNGLVFRIWNCEKWNNDRWTVLSGRVQAACWTNCGTNLLFCTNNEPIIYGLTVRSDYVFSSKSDSSMDHALPLLDLSKVDLNGTPVGGVVQTMEMDPKGNHLAVVFQETNCIVIFNVTKSPALQLMPSSLVVGLDAEVPACIGFQQNFKNGTCLTIAWSSGRIQHFPIIYTD